MENKIKEIMSDIFDIDSRLIDDKSSKLNINGWDSVNHLKLIMSLEEAFDIIIEDIEMEKMIDYLTIRKIIEVKLGNCK